MGWGRMASLFVLWLKQEREAEEEGKEEKYERKKEV